MKSYNGYSGELRLQAQLWLNREIAQGRMTRPTICSACGQTSGPIDMHAEDYSQPFAAGKTDEFHLCFSCHMAVHCRFRNPVAWDRYREMVAAGWRYVASGRNFYRFLQLFNRYPHKEGDCEKADAPPPERRPLDVIDGWLLKHTGKGWR